MKPGFEWRERGALIRLRPIRAEDVVDTRGNGTAAGIMARGQFVATVVELGWGWQVTTQAGGKGGRRHHTFKTEDQAREYLRGWYERRFRFVDPAKADGRTT